MCGCCRILFTNMSPPTAEDVITSLPPTERSNGCPGLNSEVQLVTIHTSSEPETKQMSIFHINHMNKAMINWKPALYDHSWYPDWFSDVLIMLLYLQRLYRIARDGKIMNGEEIRDLKRGCHGLFFHKLEWPKKNMKSARTGDGLSRINTSSTKYKPRALLLHQSILSNLLLIFVLYSCIKFHLALPIWDFLQGPPLQKNLYHSSLWWMWEEKVFRICYHQLKFI